MSQKDLEYQQFSEFQKNFFTNTNKFNKYTRYEVKKFGFILLNNIGKGFPGLIDIIINLKWFGNHSFENFEILRALQNKLINPYEIGRLPRYLFYKTEKPKLKGTETKKSRSKTGKEYLEFSKEIQQQICSILIIDSISFEALKHTERVQKIGKQLTGDFKS